MIRSYFVFAGLLLGASFPAVAQSSDLGTTHHSAQRFSHDYKSSGLQTPSLRNTRPELASSIVTKGQPVSGQSDDIQYQFSSNLAESFKQEKSGLLLEPRLSKFSSNDASFESYSAEIRIGKVQFEQADSQPTGWYVFAATDGEAVSLNTKSFTGSSDTMTLTLADQITIGDLQAGVSTYVGKGTQLTFSYIETEASYSARGGMSNSRRESFAGISLSKEF